MEIGRNPFEMNRQRTEINVPVDKGHKSLMKTIMAISKTKVKYESKPDKHKSFEKKNF